MKSFTLIILMLIAPVVCNGQSMFFDDLNSTTWISRIPISDSTIKNTNHVSLFRLITPLTSLDADESVWKFRNGLLTIERFNVEKQAFISSVSYSYKTHLDESIIEIFLTEESSFKFDIGIDSSGRFAVLIANKPKKRND